MNFPVCFFLFLHRFFFFLLSDPVSERTFASSCDGAASQNRR